MTAYAHIGIGAEVTILPPYDGDPYILSFQRYGRAVAVTAAGVVVELQDTFPPNERFGPFPAHRIAVGWRDNNGRWR